MASPPASPHHSKALARKDELDSPQTMNEQENTDLDGLLIFAHRLADKSAEAIMPYFRAGGTVEDKSKGAEFDPVTAADKAAEQVIRELVAAEFPEHSVLGEEFGMLTGTAGEDGCCWIVDPIDGTRSFITGYPLWGTLIGLSRRAEQLLGLMNQPFTGERFWASANGAWSRGPSGEKRLSARKGLALSQATLLSTGPEYFATAEDLERFEALTARVNMRRYGGDCYCYCMLAAGHADLVVESGLNAYDIAPLIPIIEHAGGIVTTWDGGSAALGGRILAAASRKLHETAMDILNA